MKKLLTSGLLIAALSVGACTNPNRFGSDGAGVDTGINAGNNGGVIPGSANDPTSTAFFQQTVGDRVLFEVDQSSLTAAGRATLDGQANWLLSNSDYQAVIEGHADEQGTREYNLALGARRANAAQEYLLSKGVPAARLRVVSYGKERPIEVCSNEACYAKNRRAVTVLAGGLIS
ncbi:peptidoglycan-associated lipoprotein Pal [Sulfitobacter sp. M57]|uniref:peptidoglycan-associated lipoprotein Pal n=1 Tax=unclassified Sulfitobacter TaxID=196795 RepID=UPI0023E111DC|nr:MULTISPECIES: peptidoglycan-associated lipoprotein Pal [unclassified Sulfitobacter]MDF3412954.1 peptidoglycan-associated lipoprotein Pal [Sulfitobacter sp. KE5]MDF3421762.1 peptidoglycan-associated lipoprotein Pal [Sulfitobacter sp. KE43]MDF3431503.1 peptidoglycan-associated lipoprotein Pal [Sulfitobacter sp. KE42]MDF3457144.1 peptidoglycan-associated lipoprotein Pal [Sulfitobacter sp. S74]MDF3461047.1 peptidoglycan-associated lipoprotein Pal [Sulfitobacter sp. Ks18]